ncbi:MAG: DUF3501 family protein [Acidobacteriota bacterium]
MSLKRSPSLWKHTEWARQYASVRRQVVPRLVEHRRARRVELGPNVTLLFENRTTILAQIYEQAWAAGDISVDAGERMRTELRSLVPQPGELLTTVFLQGETDKVLSLSHDLTAYPGALRLHLPTGSCAGINLDPTDTKAAVHFLRFRLPQGPRLVTKNSGARTRSWTLELDSSLGLLAQTISDALCNDLLNDADAPTSRTLPELVDLTQVIPSETTSS